MPRISLSFEGSFTGVQVLEAEDFQGNAVDVTNLTGSDLAAKLNEGELFISLRYLFAQHTDKEEEKLFDFEEG